MALISKAKGRPDGGYTRLIGDPKLGLLLSRVQSAVISSGRELEKIILERAKSLSDVDNFLSADILPEGVFIAHKSVLRKSKDLNYSDVEPDFVVFERSGKIQNCYLIELKDGDTFDTKKAAGEKESLRKFMVAIAPLIQFKVSIHFCCFHCSDRKQIVEGFKKKITWDEAMTGQEFCKLVGVNYEEILEIRKAHQIQNFEYFMNTLLEIPSTRAYLEEALGGFVNWE